MSELKYTDEQITTDNPFMDIIVTNIKTISFSCVVKDEYAAMNAETVQSMKESETYMSCREGHIELGIFKQIPHSFLVQVGVPDDLIIAYEKEYDQIYIPDQYHEALVKLMIPWYIENYDEKNEYYRMITGQPPLGDPGVPIKEYEYLIPEYITYDGNFFHEIGYEVCRSLDKLGVLDVVRAEYPEYKYLNYLTQGIDLYDARKKMDMQILYCTDQMNAALTEEFHQRYAESRKYVLNTQYSLAYEIESPFYHSFMMVYTMLITLIDMVLNLQRHIITRDILDRRCIQYIFSMYGIPYYRTIPYKYQERMCKSVHDLIKYKSCDRGFIELTKLFGFEDLTIFKWFIIKNRKMNAWGEFLYETTTQKVCNKNDFLQLETVTQNMSDDPERGQLPDDIEEMKQYYGGLGNPPSGSKKYVDKYIPFPFEYFLQKGNVMIVRLDDYVCREDIDYVVYDYNIIRFLNGIAYGKSTITFDFYYDIDTAATQEFPVDTTNRVDTYVTKGEATDDDHVFDLRDTKLTDFFISGGLQFEVILNGVWLPPNKYYVDYIERTITIDSSIALDKWNDDLQFVMIKPARFKSLYDKTEVVATVNGQTVFDIPEPFTDYILNENNFILTLNDKYIDNGDYKILNPPAQIQFVNNPNIMAGDKLHFHFFYSDQAVNTHIGVSEQVVTVKATEPYQYEFHVDFPVTHYVESGYKVYIKLLGWWLPAKFFTLIGKDTIVFLDRSIAQPTPGREMEVHFVYMPYDASTYANLQTSTDYRVSDYDFKKTFDIEFPFADFLTKGNEVVIDSEGILLKKDVDYTLTMTDDTHGTITIPNRDYRPMKGNRVNYTFFFNDNSQYKMNVMNKTIGTLTSYDQTITIPFPFYPYLETGHDFILQIGNRVIPEKDIEMIDKFHCKLYNLVPIDLNQDIKVIFFYNSWYMNHTASNFIVEWRQQEITDASIEMDTPAELYVENKWPYFVTHGNRQYLAEDKYDVLNHTFYTNPVPDLLNGTYGDSITFVYIYSMKDGYMMDATTEVHSTNTDMYFAKVPIDDIHQVQYIKDKTNWKSYDIVTSADGWWDGLYYKNNAHEVIKHDTYQKKFNYERTKYYGVSNSTDLGSFTSQLSYFYSMLYDDVLLEENVDLLIPVLSDSHRFKLSHLFVYMTTLTYIFNGYEDFILDTPTKIMYVQGFNFKTDIEEVKTILRQHHQHPSDFPIWDYIEEKSQVPDIAHFINLFKENYKVRSTILRFMTLSNDFREYSIWKKIYNALLIWKYNQEYFKLSNCNVATSYTEFLQDKDQVLYESIQTIKSYTDIESMQDLIINITDAIMYTLEKYLDSKEFKYIYSQFPGADANKAAKYLHMMIDFFKSYKIILMPRTEEMHVGDDPNDPDNYFRGIDQIETIRESTINADYMIPTERFESTEHMLLQEWVKIPDDSKQVINYQYPSFNANNDNSIRITDTGRWLKEDVSIELHGKDYKWYEINDCILKVPKATHETFLDGIIDFVRNQTEKFLNGNLVLSGSAVIKAIESTLKLESSTSNISILTGNTALNIEVLNSIYLTGEVILDRGELPPGYKMQQIYPNKTDVVYYSTMTEVPSTDLEEIQKRINNQKSENTIKSMFASCQKLTKIPSELVYTDANGTLYFDDISSFCFSCPKLTDFPIKIKYLPKNNNGKDFSTMFAYCYELETVDVDIVEDEYYVSNLVYAPDMFVNCYKLKKGVGTMKCSWLRIDRAFKNCYALTTPPEIIMRHPGGSLFMTSAFENCSSLTSLPKITFPKSDNSGGSGVGLEVTMTKAFKGCTSLTSTSPSISTLSFQDVDVHASNAFEGCTSLTKGYDVTCVVVPTISPGGGSSHAPKNLEFIETYKNCTSITHSGTYTIKDDYRVKLESTYVGCTNLTHADTITMTEMLGRLWLTNTFEGCTNLTNVDSLLNSVADPPNYREIHLKSTFKNCTGLTKVTLNMRDVTECTKIFEGCTNLVSVTFTNVSSTLKPNLTHANLDGNSILTYSISFA